MTYRPPSDPAQAIERLYDRLHDLNFAADQAEANNLPYVAAHYRRRVSAIRGTITRYGQLCQPR